ncbi:MAG TPA: hypothetical protein VGL63_12665 [Streptosporangiaceae bacterium]
MHLAVLVGYIGAGIATAWPRASYLLHHRLPASRDSASYVWGLWWMARSVRHLSNPWVTHYLAAPVGADLGYHALMPLEGVLMMPVTMAFGPSASYNLLSTLVPGLLCYAMYRVARLWLPSQTGAIAAGAFFGLSSMLVWRSWYHLNLAMGILFIPIALEAAIRLRQRPTWGRAVILGAVLGAALLTDQESAILVVLATVAALLPYLFFGSPLARLSRPAASPVPVLSTARAEAMAAESVAQTAGSTAADGGTQTGGPIRGLTLPGAAEPGGDGEPDGAAGPVRLAPPSRPARAGTTAWGLTRSAAGRVWPLALAGLVAALVASPQILAMVLQTRAGGAASPPGQLAVDYEESGVVFPRMFGISPRINDFGLRWADHLTYSGPIHDGVPTFGLLVSVLALAGLALCWRRRSAWLLMALWLGCCVLALGSSFKVGGHTYIPDMHRWAGVPISGVMPYAWFVRLPGLQGFREAARITMLGMAPAALLAGAAVNWLRYHAAPALVVVLALAILEAGWNGNPGVGTMPTAMPALDRPIAADHSDSIVLDVPFGVRGGVPLPGEGAEFAPEAQNLATADGHPRSVGFLSRTPEPTLAAIRREPFYAGLLAAQESPGTLSRLLRAAGHGQHAALAELAADRQNAQRMDIGWALVWHRTPTILRYLKDTGFVFDYKAHHVLVYRFRPGGADAAVRTVSAARGRPPAAGERTR